MKEKSTLINSPFDENYRAFYQDEENLRKFGEKLKLCRNSYSIKSADYDKAITQFLDNLPSGIRIKIDSFKFAPPPEGTADRTKFIDSVIKWHNQSDIKTTGDLTCSNKKDLINFEFYKNNKY